MSVCRYKMAHIHNDKSNEGFTTNEVIDITESGHGERFDSDIENQIPVKKSNLIEKNTVVSGFKPLSSTFEVWNMFVNFSQSTYNVDIDESNIFRERWNPYQAHLKHVTVFLSLLKLTSNHKFRYLIVEVLGDYLPSLQLSSRPQEVLLDSNESTWIPKTVKSHVIATNGYRERIEGLPVWNSFVDFCQKDSRNPFFANETQVKKFIVKQLLDKKATIDANEKFYLHNIKKLSNQLGFYLEMVHNNGVNLLATDSIKSLLLAGEQLDSRIPTNSSGSLLVVKLAPRLDYAQYHSLGRDKDFWQNKVVKTVLRDVKNGALLIWEAAWKLGVTEDMVSTALQADKKDPDINLTLKQYLKKGYGTEEMFWEEASTIDVLNQVRERIVTVETAAFGFGVSRSKLVTNVGRIKSEEEVRNEKLAANEVKWQAQLEKWVNKPSQLQKQIIMAEDNVENLSDYERMRLDNLKERQALLERLNIAEERKALISFSKKPIIPVDYGKREKSSRIKRKLDQVPSKDSFVSASSVVKKSPEWVGLPCPMHRRNYNSEHFNEISNIPQTDLDVKEIISKNSDYHKSVRFMNSISEEIDDAWEEDSYVANLSKRFEFTKIADAKVTQYNISTVDTLGDLVCYGDEGGYVGVYLAERSVTLKLHNRPVTRTLFVKEGSGSGVLSAGQDGTVRLIDLTKQEVSVKYSGFLDGAKERVDWLEHWEGSNYLINSNMSSVKMCDMRRKKVDIILSLADEDLSGVPNYDGDKFSLDVLGTNIGVHPANHNHVSICHQVSVKIFDIRNTNQPVSITNIDQLHPPGVFVDGLAGAHWSPNSGKYFLACPMTNTYKYHKPYVFHSDKLGSNPLQTLPAMPKIYKSASFSPYFGASWCPWEEAVFFTTGYYSANGSRINKLSSQYTVVAIDAVTGDVVAEVFEDLDYPTYLISCHKDRNWLVVGNCWGPGELAIYKVDGQ